MNELGDLSIEVDHPKDRVDEHKETLNEHDERLDTQSSEIQSINQWRKGDGAKGAESRIRYPI